MKKAFLVLGILAMLATSALAASQSSLPPKFTIPWGSSAGPSYITYPIPTPSQIGIVNCRASLTDGFPPNTFIPSGGGGCPPFGQDFNGILKWVTLWAQWQGSGGTVAYDSAFSASIGGYPKGAILQQASNVGCYWVNLVDNNASNPDASGTNWTGVCVGAGGTLASLTAANQTLTGGANVPALGLPTGTITVNCAARALQYIAANTAAWTINAQTNDSSCMVQIENGASGNVIPTFSGFRVGGNTGDAITTAANAVFVVTVWRIHGIASYLVKALQ